MKLLLFAITLCIFGCCSPQYIEKPPIVRTDTIYINKVKTDTIKTMVTRWLWKDSTLTAHVDTVTMKLWYRITDRDTIILTDTITVYQKPEIIEKTWLETLAIYAAPFLALIVLVLGVVIAIRR